MHRTHGRAMTVLAVGAFALVGCGGEPTPEPAAETVAAAEEPARAPALDVTSDEPMTFFLTSVGVGDGGNLGGLEGADNHCASLAEAAGAGDREWRAYLSTQEADGQPAVNARDRIGTGPWHNARGLIIAADLDALHMDNSNIRYEYALDERGETVNSGGMGDSPNMHDILTGTRMDGTAFPPGDDFTCSNWTSNGEGSAWVGHHDRITRTTPGGSWNSQHASAGCGQPSLAQTGGAGLFYCFAAN
ncbi:lectin [Gemmatimonadota bacterium DH-20]|uniref:Lectin n=2 Tax=Gaopeijia maritima TaxID=3119007 RepID=A0ABU9E5F8_9BACT